MELLGGRFRIEELAGSGGFGDVYRGYDERMERPVAIKVVSKMGAAEGEIMKKLRHRYLPQIYDLLQEGEHTIIVMEWIEGVTLQKLIEENGAVSENRAAKIGEEILEILEYLHGQKPAIIYQDLKPANIMIKPDGNISLIDLGTALLRDYGGIYHGIAGTVGYGSPEQRGIVGSQHADERSDIYAWGAVMYSMLSGRILSKPPYTMEKIRYVCPHISFGLGHVITKATKRDKEERYKTAREVIQALHGSGYVDLLYRGGFAVACGGFICPFIIVWIMGAGSGFYERLGKLLHMSMNLDSGMRIKEHMKMAVSECMNGADLKMLGLFIIVIAWMLWGLYRLQIRKFMRINRSVYLSERKYPGLWVTAIMAGMILGYGMGGVIPASVSNAEERIQEIPGKTDEEEILPVSFIEESGEKILVRYDSAYSGEGDIRLLIDRETLEKYGANELTVSISNEANAVPAPRKILLKNF